MIRSIYQKCVQVYADSSNDRKIAYLRKQGCKMGKNVKLNCGIKAFDTEPYLISLGDNVLVAYGVHFVTHDGGVFVLKNMQKVDPKTDKMASIQVGNNVYIGMGAYIMPGVKIGNNCLIGAGVIVTKDIPDNSVAVGIPAKVVETVDEYYAHCVEKKCLYPTKGLTQEEKRKYYEEVGLLQRYFQ